MDNGLSYLTTNANRLDICSQAPATYGEATTGGTYSLGNKTSPTVGSPTNGTVSGRKVVISAISDGSVTNSGTASHWALTYTTGTELCAWQTLSSSQAVTSGNTFTLDAIEIEIPDPA